MELNKVNNHRKTQGTLTKKRLYLQSEFCRKIIKEHLKDWSLAGHN